MSKLNDFPPAAVGWAEAPPLIELSTYLDRSEDVRGPLDLRSDEGVIVV